MFISLFTSLLRSTGYVHCHSGTIRCVAPHLLERLALHSGEKLPFRHREPNMNVTSSKFAAEVFIPPAHRKPFHSWHSFCARAIHSVSAIVVWCDIRAAPARSAFVQNFNRQPLRHLPADTVHTCGARALELKDHAAHTPSK